MAGGSVVSFDDTLDEGKRLIIDETWVETHVLPKLVNLNDKVYIGIPKSTADWANVAASDFDMYVSWEKTGATLTENSLFGTSGTNTIGIISSTDATYNFGFEVDNGSTYVIACDTSDMNTEPSPSEGGNFDRQVSNSSFGGPHTIVIATVNAEVTLSTTGIGEITAPNAPANLTDWTKALDFSGGNEHTKMIATSMGVGAVRMGGSGAIVPANPDTSKTASASGSRPWATTIVFKSDGNNSNQHIWNSGEGASSGDDNIYLRLTSSGLLYFGWGREGTGYNEKQLVSVTGGQWFGVYIAHNGTRLSSSDATAANLNAAFDIRVARPNDIYNDVGADQYLVTPSGYWTSTGYRMDRSVTGDITIGGRGSNRNFHGTVPIFVNTTLLRDVAMPTDAEIKMMVTDPVGWLTNYKVGNPFRHASSVTEWANFQINEAYSSLATQVYLMGDGSLDSYSNGIRNEVNKSDQNYTKMQLNSMQSNDLVTISIPGLS